LRGGGVHGFFHFIRVKGRLTGEIYRGRGAGRHMENERIWQNPWRAERTRARRAGF